MSLGKEMETTTKKLAGNFREVAKDSLKVQSLFAKFARQLTQVAQDMFVIKSLRK